MKGKDMRSILIGILVFGSTNLLAQGYPSMNFNDSPWNFNNSPLNFDNSPLNFKNSPLNFDNSPMNFNSNNSVYDNRGNRIGYETTSPSGVTNYFDNNGNRMGYSPSRR
jgi:hypothetical protein